MTSALAVLVVGVRGLDGKVVTCASVDVQAARLAPPDERFRIDMRLHGDDAVCTRVLHNLLRLGEPRGERGRELVSVDHDGSDAGVVLSPVPRDADA